ncbi:nucleotidyltransferase [Pseudoxanthomonas suwonensis]|uniref:nucleotidyltransferase n=1 Tax=Pseudoxanthomonas suwonensis TaxID=314722 RepID=UPI0012DD690F|nr:nucleotidyltransferase [Pseudoxanthomonas suwonensis]
MNLAFLTWGKLISGGRRVVTENAASYVARLAQELDVAPSRYEAAERSYHSVGEWLGRDDSSLRAMQPVVYIQGSFRLGTAIRPATSDEQYDIDLVCLLNVPKYSTTQAEIKASLGREVASYAERHGMKAPKSGRRCWTLEYADGAQFHLDALPAIRDAEAQRRRLVEARIRDEWSNTAIAITDRDHPRFSVRCENWPVSNPKGYTTWFRSRMRRAFVARREAMALEARASVEDIPSYRVKTPLQQAVQLLKLHRDKHFECNPDDKPISVIITTLAALSYGEETTTAAALNSILTSMDSHIQWRDGRPWIENPTQPLENFADRWAEFPQREQAFREWHASARAFFERLLGQSTRQMLVEAAAPMAGGLAEKASDSVRRSSFFVPAFNAGHKQAAPWPADRIGKVSIAKATVVQQGFRSRILISNSEPIRKGSELTFKAETNIPGPIKIYWQVVNTGEEAARCGQLRGGFDEGSIQRGEISRRETASYSGAHTIECFVVKDGLLRARSGAFVVNIS